MVHIYIYFIARVYSTLFIALKSEVKIINFSIFCTCTKTTITNVTEVEYYENGYLNNVNTIILA